MAKKGRKAEILDSLTPSQKRAFEYFHSWWKEKGFKKKKQILRIGAPAGYGKTYLVKSLMEYYDLTQKDCYVVSYTGQAVNVLRQNGVLAKTIHSTFYHAVDHELMDSNGNPLQRGGIPITAVKFVPVKKIPSTIKLIIIDESSFLPETLETQIASYGVPILEVGDPIQLPPVGGKQCFFMNNLDILLTEPMRQSKDSEIFDLATRIREGSVIDISRYHDQVLFMRQDKYIEKSFQEFRSILKYVDCIITTTNKQRDVLVDLYRKKILKTDRPYPVKGDRVICRKNSWNTMLGEFPLTNGTIGTVLYTVGRSAISNIEKTYTMDVQPDFISNDYYDNLLCDGEFLFGQFGNKIPDKYNPGAKFEYAQAITTHLAQGSQFQTVCFFDSRIRDEEYGRRLRYTAVTRAQKYLVYLLPPMF